MTRRQEAAWKDLARRLEEERCGPRVEPKYCEWCGRMFLRNVTDADALCLGCRRPTAKTLPPPNRARIRPQRLPMHFWVKPISDRPL
jgi:hypothetical protein